MTSALLVAPSGEAGTSDAAEEASDEGAGSTSETIEVGAEASEVGTGAASETTDEEAVSGDAGLSEATGATEVSAAEVAASGDAADSAPEATSVGVAEDAGVSVTTALVAGTVLSAHYFKLGRDLPSEVGIADSIVDGAEGSEAEGASEPGS